MFIRFMLLTVGLWVELGYFGCCVYDCRWMFVQTCGIRGVPLFTLMTDAAGHAAGSWLSRNLTYDYVWGLFVIPTIVGAIIVLGKYLFDQVLAKQQP